MKILWLNDGTGSDGQLSLRLSKIGSIMLVYSDSLDDVLELCTIHNPDLVVMDTYSLDNVEQGYIDSVRQGLPRIKVGIVSCEAKHTEIKKAWDTGADIVVPNTITPEEFIQLFKYSQKDYRVFPKSGEKDFSPLFENKRKERRKDGK